RRGAQREGNGAGTRGCGARGGRQGQRHGRRRRCRRTRRQASKTPPKGGQIGPSSGPFARDAPRSSAYNGTLGLTAVLLTVARLLRRRPKGSHGETTAVAASGAAWFLVHPRSRLRWFCRRVPL